MTCDDVRVALGALVIGALDRDEADAVRNHLAGCVDCAAEYDELRQMPKLLGLITLSEATDAPAQPPEHLKEELVQRAVNERRSARRRRIAWNVGGGAAIAAAAASISFGIADGDTEEDPRDPTLQVLAATDSGTGVSGQVKIDGVGWGSKLELQLKGVTEGETCSLVAVSTSGKREVTSTWQVPAASADGTYLSVPGAAALPPELIDTFEVVTASGSTLLILTFADLVTDVPVDGEFDY